MQDDELFQPITTAKLVFREDGLPFAEDFGDVYFSDEGGLAEARYVFLEGNRLHERLAHAHHFVVGETGFGSGLNFLALWELFLRVAPADARLHVFSVEKYPMEKHDMARVHALFPEVERLGNALRAALPKPQPGFHRLHLAEGRITLTLLYGDGVDMLGQMQAKADAWFLDGFAPRLNPDLWNTQLATQVARLSAEGATLATFSTSTSVCAAFADAGFAVEKRAGFGRKKWMLTGVREGQPVAVSRPASVQVMGGGIAGASAAYALARRGVSVTVWERGQVAGEASANPCAILYPALAMGWQRQTVFFYAAYQYSLHLLQQLAPEGCRFLPMLLFPKPHETDARFVAIEEKLRPHPELVRFMDAKAASALAGVKVGKRACFFPENVAADLGEVVKALLSHPLIEVRKGSEPQADVPVIWATDSGGLGIEALKPWMHPVRGQLSLLPQQDALQGLNTILSFGGYVAPDNGHGHYLGATFRRDALHKDVLEEDHATNLAKLSGFLDVPLHGAIKGWAGLRTVSRDRMPLVGQWDDGVYTTLAHASRGLLTSPLSGEMLASQIMGEPCPVPARVAEMLSPQRFTHRG